MGTEETNSEQREQLDLKTRIQNLRAEGKTYRKIAEIEHVSIAQISRILRQSNQQHGETVRQQGEIAARVFQLLEEGRTLPQVVIKLKFEPEVVQELYNKWVELKQIDVNQPNLEKLDQKLENHIWDHYELDILIEQAKNAGTFLKNNCGHVNPDGSCMFSTYLDEEGRIEKEISALRCGFCNFFTLKEQDEIITI